MMPITFFAYYDMRATGKNGKHLAHRVQFIDRLPTAYDVAEIGYLDNGEFIKIAETTAWNFQQGAMLQYHPFLENTVYYNVCKNGKFSTVTHNFETGKKATPIWLLPVFHLMGSGDFRLILAEYSLFDLVTDMPPLRMKMPM